MSNLVAARHRCENGRFICTKKKPPASATASANPPTIAQYRFAATGIRRSEITSAIDINTICPIASASDATTTVASPTGMRNFSRTSTAITNCPPSCADGVT